MKRSMETMGDRSKTGLRACVFTVMVVAALAGVCAIAGCAESEDTAQAPEAGQEASADPAAEELVLEASGSAAAESVAEEKARAEQEAAEAAAAEEAARQAEEEAARAAEAAAAEEAARQAEEEAAAQAAAEEAARAEEEAAAQAAAEEAASEESFNSESAAENGDVPVLDPWFEGSWDAFGILFQAVGQDGVPYQATGTVSASVNNLSVDISTNNGTIVLKGLLMAASPDHESYNVFLTDWEEYPVALYGWGSEFGMVMLLDNVDSNLVEKEIVIYFGHV